MARTEEGEFELVLGNLQLISVFLIVVILLGVFFSMGYIVGRNSAASTVAAGQTRPIVVEPPPRAAKDAGQPAAAPPPADTDASTDQPASETTPAPSPAAAQKPAPEASAPAKPERTAAPPERRPEPPSARAATVTLDRPPAGRYWQVVSTSRPEAEIISGAIAKKGLKSIVTPAPKEGFYRVIVGPLGDAADTAKTRNELEAAGFKNPILARY